MRLFRVTSSVYGGSDVIIGASWDLLPWFVAAGGAIIALHIAVKAIVGARGRAP
jgi:hypothetical protein